MLTITKSVNHPSILKFIGFSPVDFKGKNRPTLITEFMPNGSLRGIIDSCSNGFCPNEWDSTKILINIYGIAAAMSYLHSNDILHLDIKPENVLLDNSLHPKLCDFYLSVFKDSLPNTVVGTPLYIYHLKFSQIIHTPRPQMSMHSELQFINYLQMKDLSKTLI